jgi:TPR repeat protein
VAADPASAIPWFQLAAAQNYTYALINLGRCYEDGSSLTTDPHKALEYYRQAVAAGQAEGIAHMARVALKLRTDEQSELFRELTPLILKREPEALRWELGPFAGVLLHANNPSRDFDRGQLLLERLRDGPRSSDSRTPDNSRL